MKSQTDAGQIAILAALLQLSDQFHRMNLPIPSKARQIEDYFAEALELLEYAEGFTPKVLLKEK